MIRFLFYIASALLLAPAHAATVNLQTLLSNPIVSGKPGSTVEWFADLSDPIDLGAGLSLVFTGTSFDVPCQGCAPPPVALGTYTDRIGAGFAVLAPAGNCCGDPQAISGAPIGVFAISPSPLYGPITGFLEIDFALFSGDPNDPSFDPDTQTVDPDVRAFAAVTLDVVPEPRTLWLVALGGIFMALPLVRVASGDVTVHELSAYRCLGRPSSGCVSGANPSLSRWNSPGGRWFLR